MRKVGKGRSNPLNQYNLFRPGTYIIVILVQKKNLFAPIENTKAVNTASASTPCELFQHSSSASGTT